MVEKRIPETMEEILQVAIQLEEKGFQYYAAAAEKITNSVGKRMLERLANDEKNHIAQIKEIHKALNEGTLDKVAVKKARTETFETIFKRMKEQLDDAVEDLTEAGVDDEEIIHLALDLENHARFTYAEAAKKAKDPKVKKFLTELAIEEESHHDLLRKSLNYLQDPSLYFAMGDR
jgi:rubrerythrin